MQFQIISKHVINMATKFGFEGKITRVIPRKVIFISMQQKD